MADVLDRMSVTAVIASVLEAVQDQRTRTVLYVFSIPVTHSHTQSYRGLQCLVD